MIFTDMKERYAKQFMETQAVDEAQAISVLRDISLEKARAYIDSQRASVSFDDDNQLFLNIIDTINHIGSIWLMVMDDILFIGYLEIFPEYRGNGFGTQAMEMIEDKAKIKGCSEIWLNVEYSNSGAHALYTKSGFREGGLQMLKKITK